MNQGCISTYLWLVPPPARRYYYVYWSLVAVLFFVLQERLFSLFNEKHFVITQLGFSGCLAMVPIVFIGLHKGFFNALAQLSQYLYPSASEYEEWVTSECITVFTLRSIPSKLFTGCIFLSGIATVMLMGLPFNSIWMKILGTVGFSVIMFLFSQAAYILVAMMISLRHIANRESTYEFYLAPHPAISRLFRFYILAAFFVVLAYCVIVGCIYYGPYGMNMYMQGWLTFLALFPIAMFSWTLLQIHLMLQKVKIDQMREMNQKVIIALNLVKEDIESDALERLDKLMAIQDRVQGMKEWPLGFNSILSFVIICVPLLLQAISAYVEYIKSP